MIRQSKVDIQNKDIVIGMLQSISMKSYEMSVFADFGFCIIDECHHLGAQVFSRSLPKIGCKYMCGLSATPKRKDGLTKVFQWYLGPIVYQIKKREDSQKVLVELIEYNSPNKNYCREERNIMGKLCMPKMINNICGFTRRTKWLSCYIRTLVNEEHRNVLVLSDRRQHLEDFHTYLTKLGMTSIGFYVGGMKPKERKESEEKRIILGTYTMASEGMDIPSLDTIILASPKSDIRQSIGRILRKQHEHLHPKIVDVIDNFSCFQRQCKKRKTVYKRNKYEITTIVLEDSFSISLGDLVSQLSTNRV